MEAPVVVPIDSFQCREVDVPDALSWPAAAGEFGLEQVYRTLGQPIVIRIAHAAAAGCGAGLGEPFGGAIDV